MNSTKLINIIQSSSMPLEKKADLISQIQAQGISKNIRQVALKAINANINKLDEHDDESEFK